MFEAATTAQSRTAIQRAHMERAAAFAAGVAWVKSFF